VNIVAVVPEYKHKEIRNVKNKYYMSKYGARGNVAVKANRKVAGSIIDEVTFFFFNLPSPSGRTMPWRLLLL
jgi:hypothetical protein